MKHQALARVFAVVLAILCALLLLNGATGFGKAAAEHAERTAFAEKYAGRIETYRRLSDELEHSISYEDAYKELEKLMEEHDTAAAQHRTDTALYTAEKGGNTMGANLIWEAMPQIKAARAELESGKEAFAQAETLFLQAQSAYLANKDTLDAFAAASNESAAVCAAESARLGGLSAALSALMAAEPQPPVKPVEPVAPTEPVKPTEPTAPVPDSVTGEIDDKSKAEYEAAMAEYARALKEYEALKAQYDKDYAAYLKEKVAYDKAFQSWEKEQADYETAHADWEAQCTELKAGAALEQSLAVLTAQGQSLADMGATAAELVGSLGVDIASIPGIEAIGQMQTGFEEQLSALAAADPAAMTNEEFLAAVGTLQAMLDGLAGGFGAVAAGPAMVEAGIARAEQELNQNRAKIELGERQLIEAENQMRGQLENIWYNLGELEKDEQRLADEKQTLDRESETISKRLLETDELRELRNRHNSARQLLVNVAEVKKSAAESGDLSGSAEQYLAAYDRQTSRLLTQKRLINALAVAAALCGFAGIPGAYEKTRRRVFLIAPAALCLLFAAVADGLNMCLGLGQMYTALFTAIFAAIQLLIVLPKKKLPPPDSGPAA